MWPFKGPSRPATIPGDTIIPLHFYDDTAVARNILQDMTLRFDDVLDTEKLSNALGRLLELGNWRKLGARLRTNVFIPHLVPEGLNSQLIGYSGQGQVGISYTSTVYPRKAGVRINARYL